MRVWGFRICAGNISGRTTENKVVLANGNCALVNGSYALVNGMVEAIFGLQQCRQNLRLVFSDTSIRQS